MPVNGCNCCFFRGDLEDEIEINCRCRSHNNNNNKLTTTTTTTRCEEEGAGEEAYLFVSFCFVEFQLRTKCVSYYKTKGMRLVRAWMDGWMACVCARCDRCGWYNIASVAGTVARRYYRIIVSSLAVVDIASISAVTGVIAVARTEPTNKQKCIRITTRKEKKIDKK